VAKPRHAHRLCRLGPFGYGFGSAFCEVIWPPLPSQISIRRPLCLPYDSVCITMSSRPLSTAALVELASRQRLPSVSRFLLL
jgi:hypothetical protein